MMFTTDEYRVRNVEAEIKRVFHRQEQLKAEYDAKMQRLEDRLDKLTDQLNELMQK